MQTRILAGREFAAFGAITVLLAAMGLYGITAFAVAHRTHEIGIRMAVGATPTQIASLVLNRTVWLVCLDSAAGLGLALVIGGYIEPLLVGVRSRDPLALSAGMVLIAIVALCAAWIPARRAMAMDPLEALRTG